MSQLQFDADTARRIETLYEIHDAVHRRELVREALRAGLGDRILDVGCGPGFYCLELSEIVGSSGSVVGVDSSPAMLQLAQARCAGRDNVGLARRRGHGAPGRERDVRRRGLRAGSRVRLGRGCSSRRTAPRPATGRTCSRLGRGLGDGVDSLARRRSDHARAASLGRAPRHPSLPRTLGAHLRSAGFQDVRVEAHAFAASGRDPGTYGAALVPFIATFVAGRQGIGEVEAEAWGAEQRELMERDEFYFASTQFCFTATKSA